MVREFAKGNTYFELLSQTRNQTETNGLEQLFDMISFLKLQTLLRDKLSNQ